MDLVIKTLERIIHDKDFSVSAAASLESAIAGVPEDERLSDLEHILASYRPGGGSFLLDNADLEKECIRTLERLTGNRN